MGRTLLPDWFSKYLTAAFASIIIVLILTIISILGYAAYPSLVVNGIGFFTNSAWRPNPPNSKIIVVNGIQTLSGSSYGVLVFAADTLVSSAIALILAIPASLGIAIFLTQIAPRKLAAPISFTLELLAGIPSVIYGFWGFMVLSPFLLQVIEPFLAQHLSLIPFFAPVGPTSPVPSSGLLAAGVLLAIMVIPIISSISRDFMARTPIQLKDGAKALGLTKWEVTRKVVLPYAKTGIIGSMILGLGRALGETMAVAMVSGTGVQTLPTSLYFSVNTIASFMALSLGNAVSDPAGMLQAALMELAVVLLLITVTVNVVARVVVKQVFGSSENIVRVSGVEVAGKAMKEEEFETTAPDDWATIPSWQNPRVKARYWWRRVQDLVVKIASTACLILVLYPLADILYRFAYRGLTALSFSALTQVAGVTGDGGLANNIVGTMLMAGISAVIAVPIGMFGGIYLAEFSGRSRYGDLVRFVADVMAGIPSIVLGYVGFLLFVLYFGWNLSALAGGLTLAVLMLPYILRTTELSIRKVPLSIREAAEALGSTKTQMVWALTIKLALPGILTGVLLSVSIAMGETAPLLWTAGSSGSYPCGLTGCPGGVGYLTRIFYDFLLNPSPSPKLQDLAYLSAFLLMLFAISINVVARLGLRRMSRI